MGTFYEINSLRGIATIQNRVKQFIIKMHNLNVL